MSTPSRYFNPLTTCHTEKYLKEIVGPVLKIFKNTIKLLNSLSSRQDVTYIRYIFIPSTLTYRGYYTKVRNDSLNIRLVITVHERYAFLPSDLPNSAFRAGRLAFHAGKRKLWSVGLHIKSGILYIYMYFLLDF